MSIRELVQQTIDVALSNAVYVFYQIRQEIANDPNPDEYVIFTMGGDYDRLFADDEPLLKEADITVRHYYRMEKLDTPGGRELIDSRKETLLTALKEAGFSCPSGAQDAGEIDGNGYLASVIESSYERVV